MHQLSSLAAAAAASAATLLGTAGAAIAVPPVGAVEVDRSPDAIAEVRAAAKAEIEARHEPARRAALDRLDPAISLDPEAPMEDRISSAVTAALDDPDYRLPPDLADEIADRLRSGPFDPSSGWLIVGPNTAHAWLDSEVMRSAIVDLCASRELGISAMAMISASQNDLPGAGDRIRTVVDDPDHPAHGGAVGIWFGQYGEAEPDDLRPAIATLEARDFAANPSRQSLSMSELATSMLEHPSPDARDYLCERLPAIVHRVLDQGGLPERHVRQFLIDHGDVRCWDVLARLADTRYSLPGIEAALVRCDPDRTLDLTVDFILDAGEFRGGRSFGLATRMVGLDTSGIILDGYRTLIEEAADRAAHGGGDARHVDRVVASRLGEALIVAAAAQSPEGDELLRMGLALPRGTARIDWRTLRLVMAGASVEGFRTQLEVFGWPIDERKIRSHGRNAWLGDEVLALLRAAGRQVPASPHPPASIADPYRQTVRSLASAIPAELDLPVGAVSVERIPATDPRAPEGADDGAIVRFVMGDAVYTVRTRPHPDVPSLMDIGSIIAALDQALADAGHEERIRFIGSSERIGAITPAQAETISSMWFIPVSTDPDAAGLLNGGDRGPTEFERRRAALLDAIPPRRG